MCRSLNATNTSEIVGFICKDLDGETVKNTSEIVFCNYKLNGFFYVVTTNIFENTALIKCIDHESGGTDIGRKHMLNNILLSLFRYLRHNCIK